MSLYVKISKRLNNLLKVSRLIFFIVAFEGHVLEIEVS